MACILCAFTGATGAGSEQKTGNFILYDNPDYSLNPMPVVLATVQSFSSLTLAEAPTSTEATDAERDTDTGGTNDAGETADSGELHGAGTVTEAEKVTQAQVVTDTGKVNEAGEATDAGTVNDTEEGNDAGKLTDGEVVDTEEIDAETKSGLAKTDIRSDAREDKKGAFSLLGTLVPPGTAMRLSWTPQLTFESLATPTPVLVMNGAMAGPTLCVTGAVHGDEINGIEIIRRVFFDLDPKLLSGVFIGVPIVNQLAFRRNSRYLPDRRDLNRFFPGNPRGSSASRIAYTFFNEIVKNCDALVDLHTGSFHRTNLPQLRADLTNKRVAQLARGFGGMVVLKSKGATGTLRREAVRAGIPAVTVEAGEPMRIQTSVVADGVNRIRALMTNLGLYSKPFFWAKTEPVYLQSRWVRSEQGGLLLNSIQVGESVLQGDILGKVVNPVTNDEYLIRSPYDGQVIGMALNQVVMPGYAAYHIGLKVSDPFSVESVTSSGPAVSEDFASDESEDIDSPRFDVDEE